MPSFHAVSFTATLMSVHKGKIALADISGLHLSCHYSHVLINKQVHPDLVPMEVSWLGREKPSVHSDHLDCDEFALIKRDRCDDAALVTWDKFEAHLLHLHECGMVCYRCGNNPAHAKWLVSQGRRVWECGADQTRYYRDELVEDSKRARLWDRPEKSACRPGAGNLLTVPATH